MAGGAWACPSSSWDASWLEEALPAHHALPAWARSVDEASVVQACAGPHAPCLDDHSLQYTAKTAKNMPVNTCPDPTPTSHPPRARPLLSASRLTAAATLSLPPASSIQRGLAGSRGAGWYWGSTGPACCAALPDAPAADADDAGRSEVPRLLASLAVALNAWDAPLLLPLAWAGPCRPR